MNTALFAKMHGGMTHFPSALVIASLAFDLAAVVVKDVDRRRDLRAAGFYASLLGALGCFGAVLSGLLLTNWEIGGGGNLARHHLFLWPAFALVDGLTVWRLVVRDRASDPALGAYLGLMLVTSGLMAAAGYWGGEMLLAG